MWHWQEGHTGAPSLQLCHFTEGLVVTDRKTLFQAQVYIRLVQIEGEHMHIYPEQDDNEVTLAATC